ncbi:MAG: hypothetical protein ACI4DN_02785 [Lachnospiraceae bacterium]
MRNKGIDKIVVAVIFLAVVVVFPVVLILRKEASTSDAVKTSETEQLSENTLSTADEAELSVEDDYTYEIDAMMLNEDMEAYLEALDILTEEEKQLLLEENKRLIPYYEEIARLTTEIEDKTNEVVKGAEAYFDERGQIFDSHPRLWQKMWDGMTKEQEELTDSLEIIKTSAVLSKEEKDILIKEQTRLNELEAEIAKYYDKAADETKDLEAELEQNRNTLQSIMAETQHIWDKIYGAGQPH